MSYFAIMYAVHLIIFLYLYLIAVVLGDSQCTKNEDCKIDSSICVNKTCNCLNDFVFNSERTKCLKISHGYGAACTDSLQCSASLQAGGICDQGACKCVEGYHYFKGQCWKTVGLGMKCTQNLDCFVSNDFEAAACNADNVCQCVEGYYQREYSSCRKISKNSGDPCGIALDCKFDNAICTTDRVCAVKSNEIEPKAEEDEKSVDIIELCKKKRSIFTRFTSRLGSKIGGKCNEHSSCPKNAECYENATCVCLPGFYTADNNTCHPEIGGNCASDSDCKGKNTMCEDKKYCTCKQGFVVSYDNRYCDKMSRDIGWSCLRDEQCGFFGPGGKCVEKKCHCSNDTHWVPEELYCWVSKKVNEPCLSQEDCGGKNSGMTCTDQKTCSCEADSHPSTDGYRCNKNSKQVGEPCNENIDCVYEHSVCNVTTHKCSCNKGYLENGAICVSGINGTCKGNNDCKVKGSHCKDKICVCDEMSVPSNALDKCLPLATTIGAQCFESEQCYLISGNCTDYKCACTNGSSYLPDYKRCYPDKRILQPCYRSQDCHMRHSYCQNGYCMCKRGYVPRANYTICVNGGNFKAPIDLILVLCTLLALSGILKNLTF